MKDLGFRGLRDLGVKWVKDLGFRGLRDLGVKCSGLGFLRLKALDTERVTRIQGRGCKSFEAQGQAEAFDCCHILGVIFFARERGKKVEQHT